MSDFSEINVAWPELGDELSFVDRRVRELLAERGPPQLTPEQIEAFRVAFGGGNGAGSDRVTDNGPAREPRLAESLDYDYEIEGVEGLPDSEVGSRFASLSVLEERDGEDANIAQINRRAIEDQALLTNLLNIDGYYDAFVQYLVEPESRTRVSVLFTAEPGNRYTLSEINLPLLDDAMPGDIDAFKTALGLKVGDPADQDDIDESRVALAATAGQTGYAFADAPANGHVAIIGIRPEHVMTGENLASATFKTEAKVELVEPMGSDTLVWTQFAGKSFRFRMDGQAQVKVGDTLEIGFDPSKASLFDKQSEVRL